MPLDPSLSDAILARLRAAEPTLAGVILAGSHARGEADAHSDVDVVALTRAPPAADYAAWFLPIGPRGLTHVSVAFEPLEPDAGEQDEPADWALGFPAAEVRTWLWRTPEAEAARGADPGLAYPAATPELEDFIELAMKARRAAASGDSAGLRWAARDLAVFAAGLLRPLNPPTRVRSSREALQAALALPTVPAGYAADFRLCAGLALATDPEVAEAAARLPMSVLAFIRPHSAALGLDDADAEAALRDGVLEAYLQR